MVWTMLNRDAVLKSSEYGFQNNSRLHDQGAKATDHDEEITDGLIKGAIDLSQEAADLVKNGTGQIRAGEDHRAEGADEGRESIIVL